MYGSEKVNTLYILIVDILYLYLVSLGVQVIYML